MKSVMPAVIEALLKRNLKLDVKQERRKDDDLLELEIELVENLSMADKLDQALEDGLVEALIPIFQSAHNQITTQQAATQIPEQDTQLVNTEILKHLFAAGVISSDYESYQEALLQQQEMQDSLRKQIKSITEPDGDSLLNLSV